MIYLVFTYGLLTSKHKIGNEFVHRYSFTVAVSGFVLFYVNKVHL